MIVVTLPENPSTGYQWQLAKPLTLLKMEETYLAGKANAGIVGVLGTKTFKFTAEKIGQDDIHLVHIRPWETKRFIYARCGTMAMSIQNFLNIA